MYYSKETSVIKGKKREKEREKCARTHTEIQINYNCAVAYRFDRLIKLVERCCKTLATFKEWTIQLNRKIKMKNISNITKGIFNNSESFSSRWQKHLPLKFQILFMIALNFIRTQNGMFPKVGFHCCFFVLFSFRYKYYLHVYIS